MQEFNIALLTVGALVLVVGFTAQHLQSRSPLSEPLIALLAGILIGPLGFGWLRPAGWGNPLAIMEELTRLTLALSLITAALRLPGGYLRRAWKPLAIVLGIIMPLSWLFTAGLGMLLGLPLLAALLIGAVSAPTDPVLAGAIVSGQTAQQNIPSRLRWLLTGESGANDGLAYPLVLLPVLLLTQPLGAALWGWLLRVVLWEVLGAALLGAVLGVVLGRLWHSLRPGKPNEIDLTSVGALAFAVLAGTKLLGTDGLLAVFVAGTALRVTRPQLKETQGAQDALNRFFVLPVFVLLGLMLPWQAWLEYGWHGPAFVVAALLLRRLPLMLLLRSIISPLHRVRDAWLLGWFGPIGVGALFYAALAVRQTGQQWPWTLGSLLVVSSVVAHGLSATVFTQWFGRAQRRAGAPEDSAQATEP